MNKKILIGSIISVVILILVSFTSVIGYRSIESDVKVSPLFSVRSKRAIDKESKDIACDYVGKGEETSIYLTSRIKRAEQAQKAVDIISKMDDKAFSKFVARIIFNLKYQEQMADKETSEALQILYNIRMNPNELKYYYTENFPTILPLCGGVTMDYLTCAGFPCIIQHITVIIFQIEYLIFIFICNLFTWHYRICTQNNLCLTWFCPN